MMPPLYLIAYDIADRRRLGRIHRFLKARTLPLQYSVFLVRAGDDQREALLAGLRDRMDARRDDVRLYRLPEPCHARTLGRGMLPDGVFLAAQPALGGMQQAIELPSPAQEILAKPPRTFGLTMI